MKMHVGDAAASMFQVFHDAGFELSAVNQQLKLSQNLPGQMIWLNIYDTEHDRLLRGVMPKALMDLLREQPFTTTEESTTQLLLDAAEGIMKGMVPPEVESAAYSAAFTSAAHLIDYDEAAKRTVDNGEPMIAFFIIYAHPMVENIRFRQCFLSDPRSEPGFLSDPEAAGMLDAILDTKRDQYGVYL